MDSNGNIYVAGNNNNHRIRKMTIDSSDVVEVITLAGSGSAGYTDGNGAEAQFSYPRGVAVDSSGNVYVADTVNHRIRKITAEGVVSTLAGSTRGFANGKGTAAQFKSPSGVAVMGEGLQFGEKVVISRKMVYSFNKELKMKVQSYSLVLGLMGLLASCRAPTSSTSSPSPPSPPSKAWVVSTLAGSGTEGSADGIGTAAQFKFPYGVAVDSNGNLYAAERHRIRKITAEGVVTTLAGSDTAGSADGNGTAAQFDYPYGVAVDSNGNLYVADSDNHSIRKITSEGVVSTLAGSGTLGFKDGNGTAAQFDLPSDVDFDSNGNLYVADAANHRIRKIAADKEVSTLAGNTLGYKDATGTEALFDSLSGVAVDSNGNLYVADSYNHRIRKITKDGEVTTLAGSTRGYKDGTDDAAQFNEPRGVAVDSAGNVYVEDSKNHRIRKVTAEGVVTTLAGSSSAGYKDGTGTAAQFNLSSGVAGVAVDSDGIVYVADTENHRIRKIEYRVP